MRSLFLLPFLLCWLPIVEAVPIRGMSQTSTQVSFTTDDGVTHTLKVSDIPSTLVTASQAESYAQTWLDTQRGTAYQAQVHIFSLSPFSATMLIANNGETIRATWWDDGS